MKKLTFIIIILFLSSCSKEEVKLKDSTPSNSNIELKDPGTWGLHLHLSRDFLYFAEIDCYPPAINCFDEFWVWGSTTLQDCTSKADSIYYYFDYAYRNDITDQFFENYDWEEIFPGLRSSFVDSIVDGYYYITMVENTNDTDVKIYIVLEDSVGEQNWDENDVVYALPIDVQ